MATTTTKSRTRHTLNTGGIREALAVRASAIRDLMGDDEGPTDRERRIGDIAWANDLIKSEAERANLTPAEVIRAATHEGREA